MRSILSALAVSGLVALAAGPARADEGKTEVARGKVTKVDPGSGQITLSTHHGMELHLRVDDRSKLEQDGNSAHLGDFKEGMNVRVKYKRHGNENHVVSLRPALIGSGQVRAAALEALNHVKGFAFSKKEEAQRQMDARLRELDDRIDDLQEKANAAAPEARRRYEQTIDDLHRRSEAAQAKINQLGGATASSFEDLKTGALNALDDLQRAYDRAKSHF